MEKRIHPDIDETTESVTEKYEKQAREILSEEGASPSDIAVYSIFCKLFTKFFIRELNNTKDNGKK